MIRANADIIGGHMADIRVLVHEHGIVERGAVPLVVNPVQRRLENRIRLECGHGFTEWFEGGIERIEFLADRNVAGHHAFEDLARRLGHAVRVRLDKTESAILGHG